MDGIIDKASSCWRHKQDLRNSISAEEIDALRAHPQVRAAYYRLCKDELSLAELSTNTARGKVSSIYTRSSWTIALIKDYETYDDIVLSPYPAILIPFDESTRFNVNTYRVDAGLFNKSKVDDPGAIAFVEKRVVGFGDAWMTPAAGVCSDISSATRESVMLIVSGPPYGPYTHLFSSTLQYVSSSFASDLYNAKVFYSHLIRHSLAAGLLDHCDGVEVERLKQYIVDTASSVASVSEEVWPLVQAMSSVDQPAAIELLSTLAASDHELAPKARSTLVANGVDLNARTN